MECQIQSGLCVAVGGWGGVGGGGGRYKTNQSNNKTWAGKLTEHRNTLIYLLVRGGGDGRTLTSGC